MIHKNITEQIENGIRVPCRLAFVRFGTAQGPDLILIKAFYTSRRERIVRQINYNVHLKKESFETELEGTWNISVASVPFSGTEESESTKQPVSLSTLLALFTSKM